MKIGIDIRVIGKNRTGDEVYFFNLVKNLAKLDSQNEYSPFADRDPEKDADLALEIKKLELPQNFKVNFLNSPNRFWWNFWALPNCLKKNPLDIFHTQYIAPFRVPEKTKLVLTIHDISFNFFPQFIKFTDLLFLKLLIPRGIRRADKIITVSDNEKQNIMAYFKVPENKVDFTHNGVDFEKFSQTFTQEQKEDLRRKYNLPPKFLLYMGTMQPRKNLPVIIDALKYLDTILVLAGSKSARNFDKKIDEEIEEYSVKEKVIFPGWIAEGDKPVLMQIAECFVFPSLYEGFGIPGIEAMAAGTPVVASDIPVFKEVFGDAALLATPQASEDFVEKIMRIMTNATLRYDLIEKGKKVAQNFSWQKTAQKTRDIYLSLF